MFQLRDYQARAHNQIEAEFKKGHKTLMIMPTGSGKSKTIVSFISKHKEIFSWVLAVRSRKLVNQLSEDCKLFNLDYGVTMSNHDEYDPSKDIQVCSIDTMSTRGEYPLIKSPKPVIFIIDEADQALSYTFQSTINRYLNREGKTCLLGMTATPYDKPLSFFDSYFVPITALELLKRKMLVAYKYFVPKCAIDYTDVIISKGEWSTKQVEAKLDTPTMIKASFNSWLEFGDNRKTLVFCVSRKHAENFVNYANDYYEKTVAKFIHHKSSDQKREQAQKEFEEGDLIFLVNLRIITRGVDIPIIGCILDLASTIKINLHLQKIGRGSRPNPVYDDCILIDVAKNLLSCGHFYEERKISLTEVQKRNKSTIENTVLRVCEFCCRVSLSSDFIKNDNSCPRCQKKNKPPKQKKLSKAKEKELWLKEATPEMIEQKRMINIFKKRLWVYQNTGKRYSKDIARILAQDFLIKDFGLDKVLKIRRSISFDQAKYNEWKEQQYKPLDGMMF